MVFNILTYYPLDPFQADYFVFHYWNAAEIVASESQITKHKAQIEI